MKLSIVIPVYNEKNTIKELVQRVLKVDVGLIKEIIIVDDGSDDGTKEILKSINEPHIKVIYHNTNQGKGTALRTGFNEAEGDIILVQDADLEYDPKEYPRLLEPILDGRADAVYGSRFLGGPHRALYYWHYLGNRFLTAFSNMVSNLNLSDMESCYKVLKKDVLERIILKSKRFGFEPEITQKLAKLKARIYEVPISYSGRDYSEGKKVGWKDGLLAFYYIIRFKFFN
jgi:glycosyltransferase involved in cell wall biosynthesis